MKLRILAVMVVGCIIYRGKKNVGKIGQLKYQLSKGYSYKIYTASK